MVNGYQMQNRPVLLWEQAMLWMTARYYKRFRAASIAYDNVGWCSRETEESRWWFFTLLTLCCSRHWWRLQMNMEEVLSLSQVTEVGGEEYRAQLRGLIGQYKPTTTSNFCRGPKWAWNRVLLKLNGLSVTIIISESRHSLQSCD